MTRSSLIDAVERVLYSHDPIGIIFGDNPGEYFLEAETIVARLPFARTAEDVRRLVREEFVRWFDRDIAGPPQRYHAIARDVWATWLARSSTNP